MSPNNPTGTGQGQEGLNFVNALRDCLVCGVLLVDGREKITALNREAAQLLGLNPGQTAYPSIGVLPAPVESIVRETFSSGEPLSERQLEITASGHEAITLRLCAVPLRSGTKISGVVVIMNDLTPARRLEDNVWQLDRLATLGTLSASMAHEIKNALVAGKTFIDLLLEKHQDADLVEVVRRELGRIDGIVSRMLKFAAPARNAFTSVRVHEVLEHSLRLVQPQRETKAVALNYAFRATSDTVYGDDYELQQAFVNLLLNALEAMGPNGTLNVATELGWLGAPPSDLRKSYQQSQLLVTIQDTGPGIPQENIAHLFEPFFTTKASGTGLGLAITQRIILEHHGSISVESQPGQGTIFSVALPLLHPHTNPNTLGRRGTGEESSRNRKGERTPR